MIPYSKRQRHWGYYSEERETDWKGYKRTQFIAYLLGMPKDICRPNNCNIEQKKYPTQKLVSGKIQKYNPEIYKENSRDGISPSQHRICYKFRWGRYYNRREERLEDNYNQRNLNKKLEGKSSNQASKVWNWRLLKPHTAKWKYWMPFSQLVRGNRW